MYAVIVNLGKQYLVKKDQIIKIDNINKEVNSNILFENIIYYFNDTDFFLGKPYIEKCKVVGIVCDNFRSKKITVIKFKRRKNYLRTIGHKQNYTKIKIVDIIFDN